MTGTRIFDAMGMFQVDLMFYTPRSARDDRVDGLVTANAPFASVLGVLEVFGKELVEIHAARVRAVVFVEERLQTLEPMRGFGRNGLVRKSVFMDLHFAHGRTTSKHSLLLALIDVG